MNTENNDVFENQNGQLSLFEEEGNTETLNDTNDELRKSVEEQLEKIRNQSMLIGAQVSCKVILDKINTFERSSGKKTNNDHKRLIKDIKNFCQTGLSRKVNFDGTTEAVEEPVSETVQN